MNIFILEDSTDRIVLFKNKLQKNFPGAIIKIAQNVKSGKDIFLGTKWDIIFLDHDLEEEHYNPENWGAVVQNTGYEFAQFLSKELVGNAQVVIHSMNPVGSENIRQELASKDIEADICPFSLLIRQI